MDDGPMKFTAPRAKRWLQAAIKNKYVTMEEIKVQIVLAAHKDHPNFIKNVELGICEISAEFAKFMEEIEIVSLASKILPEWINGQQKYHKCTEAFTSKSTLMIKTIFYFRSGRHGCANEITKNGQTLLCEKCDWDRQWNELEENVKNLTSDTPILKYNEFKSKAIGAFNEIHIQVCENYRCPLHLNDKTLWPNTSNVSTKITITETFQK